MLIPLGTDRPLRRPTLVVYALIALNVIVYLVDVLAAASGQTDATLAFRLQPGSGDAPFIVSGLWTLITYAFLHGGPMHILFNMLFLYVLGPNVEDRLGRFGFLAFYLGGGIAAGLAHALFSNAPVVGASGAVAAVTGAYIVLFPKTRIKVLLFFILIGVFMIPSWWFIAFAIVKDFIPVLLGSRGRVAYEAHLGGYAFGIAVSFALLIFKVIPHEPYELATIMRQAKRRRQFREATSQIAAEPSRLSVDRPSTLSEDAVALRTEVARAVASNELDRAATGYKGLLDRHADEPTATVLSRSHQLTLGNHLFAAGDHALAARAYERFIEAYPRDDEMPRTSLMLALLYVRYLSRGDEGKALIERVFARLRDDDTALAKTLLAEISEMKTNGDDAV